MNFYKKNPIKYFAWSLIWTTFVFVLDRFIRHHSLYWLFKPSDKIMHTIAGIAIGTFTWGMITWLVPNLSVSQKFLIMIGVALLVGVTWEVLERYFALLNPHIMKFDLVDTIGDIFSDTLGGDIASLYFLII